MLKALLDDFRIGPSRSPVRVQLGRKTEPAYRRSHRRSLIVHDGGLW